jgi:hypothetical protein
LEPKSQGLESLLGVAQQRPADVPGFAALRSRLGEGLAHGGAGGPGHRLLDPQEAVVDPFLEGPLMGRQDLLNAGLPGSRSGDGLRDGDGVGETLPGRAPPRRLGDRRRWWL